MGWVDPIYYLYLAPGLLLTIWAQARVMRAYAEGSKIPARSGLTGAEAAARIMQAEGVGRVAVEPVAGELTDHYDPTSKVLRLSEGVYAGRSLAALGIAAHESGHAAQDAQGYPLMVVRNLIVPVAGIASSLSMVVLLAGFLLWLPMLIIAGIWLFSAVVAVQLVTLPVEFDASRRARRALAASGLVTPEEDAVVGRVLDAAAWTYVAGTLTSILTLLYYLYRAGFLGNRRGGD